MTRSVDIWKDEDTVNAAGSRILARNKERCVGQVQKLLNLSKIQTSSQLAGRIITEHPLSLNMLGVDLMCQFPRSSHLNEHLLVVVD